MKIHLKNKITSSFKIMMGRMRDISTCAKCGCFPLDVSARGNSFILTCPICDIERHIPLTSLYDFISGQSNNNA